MTIDDVRLLDDAADLRALARLFDQVWASTTPLVGVELLRAVGHAGGYVAGAFDDGTMVGGSFGFLARHDGEPALHSHVTGVLARGTGAGRALKAHQRAWAAANGLRWVTWTFDPLVRANAWFNLVTLRASVREYLVDFYGPIEDLINRGDESDRLLVTWPSTGPLPRPVTEPDAADRRVATPPDVVALRAADPAAAAAWRPRLRQDLGGALAAGGRVVGITRTGDYLVRP